VPSLSGRMKKLLRGKNGSTRLLLRLFLHKRSTFVATLQDEPSASYSEPGRDALLKFHDAELQSIWHFPCHLSNLLLLFRPQLLPDGASLLCHGAPPIFVSCPRGMGKGTRNGAWMGEGRFRRSLLILCQPGISSRKLLSSSATIFQSRMSRCGSVWEV
jgi:hypothetical protein